MPLTLVPFWLSACSRMPENGAIQKRAQVEGFENTARAVFSYVGHAHYSCSLSLRSRKLASSLVL